MDGVNNRSERDSNSRLYLFQELAEPLLNPLYRFTGVPLKPKDEHRGGVGSADQAKPVWKVRS